ncbi:MAG: hypothetical protein ACI9HY_002544, partial [Planctomycetaceae bacterium]
EDEVLTLTGQQLNWLLDGLNIKHLMPASLPRYQSTI